RLLMTIKLHTMIDGAMVEITHEDVTDQRAQLFELRDSALKAKQMEWAAAISVMIRTFTALQEAMTPWPPTGWKKHPTAAGWYYKGQEVLNEEQLRKRFS